MERESATSCPCFLSCTESCLGVRGQRSAVLSAHTCFTGVPVSGMISSSVTSGVPYGDLPAQGRIAGAEGVAVALRLRQPLERAVAVVHVRREVVQRGGDLLSLGVVVTYPAFERRARTYAFVNLLGRLHRLLAGEIGRAH